jgi:acyl transferase domain-containing protein
LEGDKTMNNKLSEGLLALAKALEDLAYQHATEIEQQNDRLDHIENTAERTKHALKGFAENLLNNLG